MEKRHRIFIAINLPEAVKSQLFSYSEKWPELPAKWTAKDNLHITLVFLGDLTDQELGDACMAVKEVAQKHSSFSLNINRVLYGPSNKIPPKFVWAEGEKSKELSALKNDLEKSLLEKIKFAPEGRGFTPHITLARISSFGFNAIEPEERPEIDENIDIIFTVESIEVMESVLKKGGPQYTILESHNLQ